MTKEQVLEEFDKGYDCCQVVISVTGQEKFEDGYGAGL